MWGAQYSFGVFFKSLVKEFGWNRAVTSGAFALNLALTGLFGIFSGRLSDRFGPRLVVTVCGFFVGLSYMLMSMVDTTWQVYLVYGVLLSIGISGSWIPLMSTVARWFVRGRGLASGIVASGIGVGITIMPPLANYLISKYSWKTSFLIIGIIAMALIITMAQFLRRDPEQKNFLIRNNTVAKTDSLDLQVQGFSLQKVIHTGQFWIINIEFLAFGICHQIVMVHIVPHATDMLIPASTAAAILSVIGIVSIGGKIGMGSAGDRIGNRWIVITVFALMALSFWWLSFAREIWMLILFAVVYGFAYGGFAAMQAPIVVDLFGLRAHGAIFGLIVCTCNVGGAIGSFVAGRIFDITSNYYWAFILCAILAAVALISATIIKPVRNP